MSEKILSMLDRAHQSLTAAIDGVREDREAAVDDMVAARLLIATVLVKLTGVGIGAGLG